jgi:hypothetical protein
MISTLTLNVVLFLFGTLVGIYLPAVALYAWIQWRAHASWKEAARYLIKKILWAMVGLTTILAFLGFILNALGFETNPLPEENAVWLGLGWFSGLTLGAWIAQRAVRRRNRNPSAAQSDIQSTLS